MWFSMFELLPASLCSRRSFNSFARRLHLVECGRLQEFLAQDIPARGPRASIPCATCQSFNTSFFWHKVSATLSLKCSSATAGLLNAVGISGDRCESSELRLMGRQPLSKLHIKHVQDARAFEKASKLRRGKRRLPAAPGSSLCVSSASCRGTAGTGFGPDAPKRKTPMSYRLR